MTGASQQAFTQVLWVVVALGLIGAIAAVVTSGKAFEQIGKGGLFDEDDGRPPAPASPAVQAEEIRQMLEARNARRIRRGETPLDVDRELAALTRPDFDPALLAEIRELVEARNRRRVRQGREPLDVEAEVSRYLIRSG